MDFDPTGLAIIAFVLLGASAMVEAYHTYRAWWRRWCERRRPSVPPRTHPHLVYPERPDLDDQAPYGRGTSLRG
jgi:hypothetical protein|tara:strand:- start:549 stop:770 length:222 start_codon:yes stop_codon:yes gene_type:complete